jgi:pimeloyl-ACP methyl ester carboxylesterase
MKTLFRLFGTAARIACVFASAPAAIGGQDSVGLAPFSAPGRLIDVGGWRLHLNCTSEARSTQPTVILEAGLGDFSVEWSLVQPGVARFARVCSYDRAGDGWSEFGPHPRTFRQIVYELHTLLERARERPPYVLVGHSYGGWLVRLYQSTYPSEVAGMVLVEAGAENPWRMMPDGRLVRSSDLASGQAIPSIRKSNPLRIGDIPYPALAQIRAGLPDASRHANDPPRNKLPPEAQRMRTWALGQVGHIVAAVNPFENEELALLREDRRKSEYPLGDIPLIVITRGLVDETGPDATALEAEHRRDQAAVAVLSRRGKQIIAAHSGHHVQLEEPDLVVSTIQQIIAMAQGRFPR